MSEIQQTQAGYLQIPAGENATMARLLSANLGREVVAEFLVGTDDIVRKAGILYAASAEYMVLYDDVNLTNIACYLPSLRFVTFYLSGTRPDTSGQNTASRQAAQQEAETRGGVRPQTQAAFNYAKRKTRKLD